MSRFKFNYPSFRSDSEFNTFFKTANKIESNHCILFFSQKQTPTPTFSFVASKRIGNACIRNTAKRKLRETVRLYQYNIKKQYSTLWVAKKNKWKSTTPQEIINKLIPILKKEDLWIE